MKTKTFAEFGPRITEDQMAPGSAQAPAFCETRRLRRIGLSLDRLVDGFRRFRHAETGSATIEFVIWAPTLIFIGVAMFVLSYYIATISEVQQVVHGMARSSIALVNGGAWRADLCEQLGQEVMPRLVAEMAVIDITHFAPMSACPSQPDALDFVTLSVSYDLHGSALHSLGQIFGIDLGVITRTSTIQL